MPLCLISFREAACTLQFDLFYSVILFVDGEKYSCRRPGRRAFSDSVSA